MLFRHWQIGVDIQHDALRVVAVQRQRYGWQLRGWWQAPLEAGWVIQGRVVDLNAVAGALARLRRQWPLGYRIRVGMPVGRTVLRHVPSPAVQLREQAFHDYVGQVAARQLDIPVEKLCWDYTAQAERSGIDIVAAHHEDVTTLQRCLSLAQCRVDAITPDALALGIFQPVVGEHQWIICRTCTHWVWSSSTGWGSLPVTDAAGCMAVCDQLRCVPQNAWFCGQITSDDQKQINILEPWRAIQRVSPPLPDDDYRYALAVGLAMGEYPQ